MFHSSGRNMDGGRQLDELHDILQHSPHITGYVQEICLVVKDNDSWVTGNPKFEWAMDHLTWNRVFTWFHFDGHLSGDKSMTTLSHLPLFKKCFSQCYIVPFITSLKLYRVKNVPIGLMASSYSLKKLSLIHTTFGDLEKWNPTSNNITLPQLQELYFYCCSDTITTLIGNPNTGSPPLLDLLHLYMLLISQDSLEDIRCAMRVIQATSWSSRQINFIHHNSNVCTVCSLLVHDNWPSSSLRTIDCTGEPINHSSSMGITTWHYLQRQTSISRPG